MLEIIDFTCIIIEIYLCSNYVVKKRHEQVEKTLEMKKWSRNGSIVTKQGTGRNVYDVLAI